MAVLSALNVAFLLAPPVVRANTIASPTIDIDLGSKFLCEALNFQVLNLLVQN